ncbi:MAG: TadE/TadG family type IV pilus assembly protein [Terriglobales bacterium]
MPEMRERRPGAPGFPKLYRRVLEFLCRTEGSAILEFSITLPLLVVFVVGIYDFSGAFNQRQKIEQAAQEGAIIAGGQPMTDIDTANTNPTSLQPVVTAIFNSLAASGVLPNNGSSCTLPWHAPGQSSLTWTYTITGCSTANSGDQLVIAINRGWSAPGSTTAPSVVGTVVTVTFPYHWRFNSVIQLLLPGASYAPVTSLTESSTVHNQM